MESIETKMWSYKLVYDELFAPNPLWGILTLATCKPKIRKSPNSIRGTWIARWTACTIHNSELFGSGIDKYPSGHERLVFLAQIDDSISLDEYWERYPNKRNNPSVCIKDARLYGDNIYHNDNLDCNGNVVAEPNMWGHNGAEVAKRDYMYGKRALICKRFYYFTREHRLEIDPKFIPLVHHGRGESLKKDTVLINDFIDFVEKKAKEMNVENGIVGHIPVVYPNPQVETVDTVLINTESLPKIQQKKGCAKCK